MPEIPLHEKILITRKDGKIVGGTVESLAGTLFIELGNAFNYERHFVSGSSNRSTLEGVVWVQLT